MICCFYIHQHQSQRSLGKDSLRMSAGGKFSVSYEELAFPDSSGGEESTCNAGHRGLIPGSGRYPGAGIGYLLQRYWGSLVAQLIIRLQCRWPKFNLWVGKIPWRRERLPTPVFWPGEFHGLYSLWGHERVGHDWVTFTMKDWGSTFLHTASILEVLWRLPQV